MPPKRRTARGTQAGALAAGAASAGGSAVWAAAGGAEGVGKLLAAAFTRMPGAVKVLGSAAIAAISTDAAVIAALVAIGIIKVVVLVRGLIGVARLYERWEAGKVVDAKTGRRLSRPRIAAFLAASVVVIEPAAAVELALAAFAVVRHTTGTRLGLSSAKMAKLRADAKSGALLGQLGRIRVDIDAKG